MSQHPNARLAPRGRELPCSRVAGGTRVPARTRARIVARSGLPRLADVERVMTDDGPGCRSRDLDALPESRGVRHLYTRPHGPWQNGKAGRMNRTLAQERRYGRARESEAGRADALPAYLEHYNWGRPHSACGGLPPMSRTVGVNNLLAHNS